jgi:hypothetical protein
MRNETFGVVSSSFIGTKVSIYTVLETPGPPFSLIHALAVVLYKVSQRRVLKEAVHLRSRRGDGKFRWYLLPPGAVGGLYGSGCFHFSSSASVCSINSCFPVNIHSSSLYSCILLFAVWAARHPCWRRIIRECKQPDYARHPELQPNRETI